MNYTQPYAHGIDATLQFFQTRLWDLYLTTTLGLDDDSCMCFGRVNRVNVKGEGYLPVAYYNGQYLSSSGTNSGRDLFFESGKVIVFFDLMEHIRKGNDYIMKVALMVFADMSVVTPAGLTSTVQRLDEDLLIGFEQFVTYNGGFTVKSTTFDIDKVLERYSGTVKKNALTRNMSDSNGGSNFCAIRIVMEKAYDPLADQNNLPEISNI